MSFISPTKISAKGIKETLSLFEDLKKQQKFAQALTAQHAAREVKKWTLKKLFPYKKDGETGFKRRGSWASTGPYSFKVTPRKVNRNNPTAVIESSAPWIQGHQKGTTRTPKYSSTLGGVPLPFVGKGKPRRSTYAKIPTERGPVNLYNRKDHFIGKSKKGNRVLFQRVATKKGVRMSGQYMLPPRVKIRPKLGFVKRGRIVAKLAYIKLYPGNFLKALKSSNRRKVKSR